MVQRKQIANGSRLLIAEAPSGTLAAYGRVERCTLPFERYETIEAPELNPQDNAGVAIATDPVELGDQQLGEFEFTHYWDPMHAQGALLNTHFAAKQELIFAFDSPHATSGSRITTRGRIIALEPEELVKGGYWKRKVVCIRTAAVTIAARPA
jgi:hypothetical protein